MQEKLENYGLIFTFFPLSESCSWVCAQHGRWWLCGENASINERIKLFPLCISSLFRVTIYQQNKAVLSSFIWLKKQKTLVWLLHIFNPFWKLIVRAKLWGKADDFSYCFINTFCEFYNFTQFWYQRRD